MALMHPIKINHVAIVAPDMDGALHFWRDALGLELHRTEYNAAEAVDVAFLAVGDSEIELLTPTTGDSGIAKYLEKRGPGFHHLCVEVEDIVAAMDHLRGQGVELINEIPRQRPNGILYAFVHPRSAGGVMVELYQLPAGN
jgi:methylmalonyl-CoA/ethylmalonyl-CoA epimerase